MVQDQVLCMFVSVDDVHADGFQLLAYIGSWLVIEEDCIPNNGVVVSKM